LQEARAREDAEQHKAELNAILQQLARKRRIKYQVQAERQLDESVRTPVALETIPIRVHEASTFVHYPAGVDDIQEVMRRLPIGVSDGIRSIDLYLGRKRHDEHARTSGDEERDPLAGRIGVELWPGAYSGRILGTYFYNTAKIQLFAYVYDGRMPDRSLKELYLRLKMLATFVHEVAHHYDHTMRVARGRWLADDTDKVEIYAEDVQHEWVQRYVVPYLAQAYPEECRALDAWIEHHGGVSVPLALLAGDPRTSVKGNRIRIIFSIPGAFEKLVEIVTRGEELTATRLEFARELHYGENYAEALVSIYCVLEEHPEDAEALTLQADIAVHQQEYDLAHSLCERVLARDESYVNAWEVLADLHWTRRSWARLQDTTTRILTLVEPTDWYWGRALRERARARLELGDWDGLVTDLDQLWQSRVPKNRYEARALLSIMCLRKGYTEAALKFALMGLHETAEHPLPRYRAALAAVRLEAAHRLGRPSEAGELTTREIQYLRSTGHEAWMDRLMAEHGDVAEGLGGHVTHRPPQRRR
jgi:tetratricopeptide (TPR) repeat protein